MTDNACRTTTAALSSLNASSPEFRSLIRVDAPRHSACASRTTERHSSSASSVSDDESHQKPFVILVEDDDVVAIVATQLLQQVGVHPRRCVDGNEAFDLACFSSERPDLILMDLNMPGMDGIASTRLIREFYQARALPCPTIIGFTSMSDAGSQSQMRSAGVIDFLPKPPTIQDIRRVVLSRIL